LLGGTAGFAAGRWRGEPALLRIGRLFGQQPERVQELRGQFETHAIAPLFIARFITGLRNVAGLLAGASGVGFGRFLAVSAIAALAWSALITLEYYFRWPRHPRGADVVADRADHPRARGDDCFVSVPTTGTRRSRPTSRRGHRSFGLTVSRQRLGSETVTFETRTVKSGHCSCGGTARRCPAFLRHPPLPRSTRAGTAPHHRPAERLHAHHPSRRRQCCFHELGAVPGTAITTLETSAPKQIGQSGRRPGAVAARAEESLAD
jgi:hypothetical protein